MIDIEPLPGDIGTDVRLVLMVGADDFDFHAVRSGIEILDRHLGCGDRARSADVSVEARHVIEHAELDSNVLGLRGGAAQGGGRDDKSCSKSHLSSSLRCGRSALVQAYIKLRDSRGVFPYSPLIRGW